MINLGKKKLFYFFFIKVFQASCIYIARLLPPHLGQRALLTCFAALDTSVVIPLRCGCFSRATSSSSVKRVLEVEHSLTRLLDDVAKAIEGKAAVTNENTILAVADMVAAGGSWC
jgi:hypothetical protein